MRPDAIKQVLNLLVVGRQCVAFKACLRDRAEVVAQLLPPGGVWTVTRPFSTTASWNWITTG